MTINQLIKNLNKMIEIIKKDQMKKFGVEMFNIWNENFIRSTQQIWKGRRQNQ